MLRFLVHRVLASIPTLLVVSLVVFGLQKLLPGDIAQYIAGEEADPTQIAAIRESYRLNDSIPLQYLA